MSIFTLDIRDLHSWSTIQHFLLDAKCVSWLTTFTSRAVLCLWKNVNGVWHIHFLFGPSDMHWLDAACDFRITLPSASLDRLLLLSVEKSFTNALQLRVIYSLCVDVPYVSRSSCISLEELFSTNWSNLKSQPAHTPWYSEACLRRRSAARQSIAAWFIVKNNWNNRRVSYK